MEKLDHAVERTHWPYQLSYHPIISGDITNRTKDNHWPVAAHSLSHLTTCGHKYLPHRKCCDMLRWNQIEEYRTTKIHILISMIIWMTWCWWKQKLWCTINRIIVYVFVCANPYFPSITTLQNFLQMIWKIKFKINVIKANHVLYKSINS